MSGKLLSILSRKKHGKEYTLHFDGSHNNQANKSGAGCVIRDRQGNLIVAAAYNLTEIYPDYCNVAIAEAVALRNGLRLAKDLNLDLNLIEGDSKEVIDHVLDRSRRPSRPPLSGIIQQIAGMIDPSSQKIVIIDREANQVADKLAFWGSNRIAKGSQLYWTDDDLPHQVAEPIKLDKSRYSRREEDAARARGEGSSKENLIKVGALLVGAVGAALLAYKNSQNNDYYTLHYSGSDINQLHNGGAGCIIRNKQGELVAAAAYNLNNLFPNQYNVAIAEAIAWRNGLNLAKKNGLKLDLIKGDNVEVIKRVRGQEKKPPGVPLLNDIVVEIREVLQELSIDLYTKVELIGSEANKVANELANLGSKLGFGMEQSYGKDEFLPGRVARLIQQDEMN